MRQSLLFVLFTKIIFLQCIYCQYKTDLYPTNNLMLSSPAICPDGTTMAFVANNNGTKKVYESRLVDGIWSDPKSIDVINSLMASALKVVIGGLGFNYNGTMLFFHASLRGNTDIFYTQYINGEWTSPESFGEPINTSENEYSPSISVDNKLIFILRDKKGVENDENKDACKEMFLYEKDKENRWQGPVYMPSIFNVGCQETPFICADNKTLFFSSLRPDTNRLGKDVSDYGFNIYYAKRLNFNTWQNPKYIDEFSGQFNDLSPVMSYKSESMIFNIQSENQKKQANKIYSVPMPAYLLPERTKLLKGRITDLNTNVPIDAQIVVYNSITSVVMGNYNATSNGDYSIVLQKDINYKIDFYKEGYSHVYKFLNTSNLSAKEAETYNLKLYKEVQLKLNVFDSEVFDPLTPNVFIADSSSGFKDSIKIFAAGVGRYNCNLKIGEVYKINISQKNYNTNNSYFDLATDVQFSEFEKDVELAVLKKTIVIDIRDELSNDTINANVDVINLSRNENTESLVKKDVNDNFVLELREGDRYEIDIAKKGYTYYNTKIDVDKVAENPKLEIKLSTLSTQTKMIFNDITFETNSAELNSNSFDELMRLARFMHDNPDIFIEISAHTDDVGSDLYNQHLSLKRAQTVVEFLKLQTIESERMVSKGYGESMPVLPNTNDDNRARNRRVELRIIDKPTVSLNN